MLLCCYTKNLSYKSQTMFCPEVKHNTCTSLEESQSWSSYRIFFLCLGYFQTKYQLEKSAWLDNWIYKPDLLHCWKNKATKILGCHFYYILSNDFVAFLDQFLALTHPSQYYDHSMWKDIWWGKYCRSNDILKIFDGNVSQKEKICLSFYLFFTFFVVFLHFLYLFKYFEMLGRNLLYICFYGYSESICSPGFCLEKEFDAIKIPT